MFLSLTVSLALAAAPPTLLPTSEAVLPNGLRIIVHAWPDDPLVAVRLLLPAGAAADPPGRAGLAHLVEHLAFEGSAHAPEHSYDRWLAAAGGTSDASTRHDATIFSVTVPPGALPLALFLESDRLGWLTPSAAALANQRSVVENERAESAGSDQVRSAFAPLLWPEDHPYARTVIGVADELAAVTLEDVQAFARHGLQPDGAVLVIAGPVDVGAVLDQARRWFDEIPGVPSPAPTVATLPEPSAVRAWVRGDVDRVRLQLGWRTVERTHPDRVALELAGALLADRLRDHGVGVNAWSGRFGGELTLAANTTQPRAMMRRMSHAVRGLAREGPSEDALTRILARARAWELRALQTSEGRAARLLDCAERTGVSDCLPTEWEARARVDPAAIRRVVQRWLVPTSSALLALTPTSRRHAPLPGLTRVPPS